MKAQTRWECEELNVGGVDEGKDNLGKEYMKKSH